MVTQIQLAGGWVFWVFFLVSSLIKYVTLRKVFKLPKTQFFLTCKMEQLLGCHFVRNVQTLAPAEH